MAADPLTAVLLAGLGLRELSMTPAAIPRVKAALRAASAEAAAEVARACLDLPTAAEIEATVRLRLGEALLPAPLMKE
jgi:phosphoenolpyruvate-protein kinase (PTS system EI component)